MHETAVQFQMPVDVPERILPVTVVQMRIAAKHLLDDASHVRVEVGWEAGRFTNPVVLLGGKLREGSRERGGRSSDGGPSGVVGRGGSVTRSKGSGGD